MTLSLVNCKIFSQNKIAETIFYYFGENSSIGINSKVVNICLKKGIFRQEDSRYVAKLSDKLTRVQLILAADKNQVIKEVPEEAELLFKWAEVAATKDKNAHEKAFKSVKRHVDEAMLEKLNAFTADIILIGQNYLVEKSGWCKPEKMHFIGPQRIQVC
jgi:hypothetical protein